MYARASGTRAFCSSYKRTSHEFLHFSAKNPKRIILLIALIDKNTEYILLIVLIDKNTELKLPTVL